jgi:hypothetical protein
MKKRHLKTNNKSDLQQIPGVGPSISQDLFDIGILKISDLNGKNPQQMYTDLCHLKNAKIDHCVLYIFRCAVYFAETCQPEPELLKWWNWKNREYVNSKD